MSAPTSQHSRSFRLDLLNISLKRIHFTDRSSIGRGFIHPSGSEELSRHANIRIGNKYGSTASSPRWNEFSKSTSCELGGRAQYLYRLSGCLLQCLSRITNVM